jgi:gamma-glutamyltranspeptidase/glutathione hydrolase
LDVASPDAPTVPGREGQHTTHFLVVDRHGTVVSNTYTLNDNFGSGLMVSDHGFLLNNELDDFTAKPGAPNLYSLVQGERNLAGPGRRPVSSMSPTIVLKDGEPVLALGSPGGSRITNAVFQVLVNRMVWGMTPVRSVRRPRLHHQWLPDVAYYEASALDPASLASLTERGHVLEPAPEDWGGAIGHVHLLARREDGSWVGVVDRRRPGGMAWGLD